MLPRSVSAFWTVVLYGAAVALFWSGATEGSTVLTIVAWLCGVMGFGAMLELFKRRGDS